MRSLLAVAASAAALALAACSGAPSSEPDEAVRIDWFEADPFRIVLGSPVHLTWRTAGASSLSLRDRAGKEFLVDGGAAEGDLSVWPTESTTYFLVATGSDGVEAAESVRVEVIQPKPVIERFAANPGFVRLGEWATLWWIVRGADSVTVVDEEGKEWRPSPGESRVEVKPTRSTVYTLIATGNGEAREFVLVDMEKLPAISASIWPAEGALGSSFRLSWSSRGADSVEILANGEPIPHDGQAGDPGLPPEGFGRPPNGFESVVAWEDTRYEVIASGPDGKASAFVDVRIIPFIGHFEFAEPGPIRPGSDVTLSWSVLGAHSIEILGDGEVLKSWDSSVSDEGSMTVPVGASGRFELVARRGARQARVERQIEVTEAPIIHRFEADPVVASQGRPGETTVRWEVDGAEEITLSRSPGGAIEVPEGAAEVTVAVEGHTTFTLTARNEHGTTTRTARPKVAPHPSIFSFRALPARVAAGQEVKLDWHVMGHAGIRILRDGVEVYARGGLVGIGFVEEGRWTDRVTADTTYELQAFMESGEHTSEEIRVTVGSPIIRDFAGPAAAQTGSVMRVSWSCEGGTGVEIFDSDRRHLFATTDLAWVESGSSLFFAPLAVSDEVYTLRVSDPLGGWDERSIAVAITDGPVIRLFSANRSILRANEPLWLTWQIEPDVTGALPDLRIEGTGLGSPIVVPRAAIHGELRVVPASAGLHSYTLTATTPGTRPATAEVEIDVRED